MKKLALFTGILCALTANAQNDIDAMRYSQITFGGTARFSGMAGSMGALGGDISTLATNPAGIAVYRKTELTITPSIFSSNTSSSYNAMTSGDRKLNFNIANIGLVTTFHLKDTTSTGWRSLNFGLGYNRYSNFSTRTDIQGYNKTSSLLDVFVADANGHAPSEFDGFSTDLAYQAYLINPDTTSGPNIYNHVIPNYGELQKKSVSSSGGMGETDLSFGGNYRDRVLIGASVGFIKGRYVEESVYSESDEKDSIPGFNNFTYTQNLQTSAKGVNFKLGIIIKATDWLRLGAAIHTPGAIYDMKDNYSSTLHSSLGPSATYDVKSPSGSFNYGITTPLRAIGSIGFIIEKIGLINAEYEYVNYSDATLFSTPNVFADVNNTIRSKYTSTGNVRVGGELRLDPISFRLGYAFYGSPFAGEENKNANRSNYTAGVGFHENNYYFDFAYVLSRYTEYSFLYAPNLTNPVQNDIRNSSFLLTFGVKF